jgi:fumarylacetoacetase
MASNPNDPTLRSFIEVAPDSDFPIQNLSFGVFSTGNAPAKRVGVAAINACASLTLVYKSGNRFGEIGLNRMGLLARASNAPL